MSSHIRNIAELERELHTLYELSQQHRGDNKTLERMWPLLNAAGNPHKKLRVIHIAGTSGKTSTAYYIATLLRATGARVGLTVSPHVDSITERIQVDGHKISEDEFCTKFSSFLAIIQRLSSPPSYFEAIIGFAYWYFARIGVDYAVIETGMGGLHDASNVAQRPDKICVITDIGLDHMDVLGSNIVSIAEQKAGIIHAGNKVFVHQQSPEVMRILTERTDSKQAKLNVISESDLERCVATTQSNLPQFQIRNWCLSLAAADYVCERDGREKSSKLDPLSITVPGRMETVHIDDGSVLIMDGAHNGQKVSAFVRSFQVLYPDQKATVLLALKEGKEHVEVLKNLKPICSSLIITTFTDEQDFPIVSQDPEAIADEARTQGLACDIVQRTDEAYKKLLSSKSDIKLVIGSIYLLGRVRAISQE